MVIPTLEARNEVGASKYLKESLNTLKSDMRTQFRKTLATLSASKATKREKGKERAAREQ